MAPSKPIDAPNRIRELRKQRGFTLAQLGEALGTTPTHINRLERGQRDLTHAWMLAIARVLGVSPAVVSQFEFERQPGREP